MSLFANAGFAGPQALSGTLALWLIPLFLAHWLAYRQVFAALVQRVPDWLYALVYAVIVVHALAVVPMAHRPFIYFQF